MEKTSGPSVVADGGNHVVESGAVEIRKRKNRWGTLSVEDTNSSNDNLPTSADEIKKVRLSRWSSAEPSLINAAGAIESVAVSNIPPEVMQQTLVLKLQLQQINEKVMTVVQDAINIEKDPNRSPSPPPKYDSNGKRTNTREMRMRENFAKERIQIIEELIKLNPQFMPPGDFIKGKPVRRIFIPKQVNPLYNFIGIIIGPRGNTQKKMELETGCKISIRGKGSSKEGSRGRANKNVDDDEELHVHITGDDEDRVELAAQMVSDLLKPVDENLNIHKQQQLRELALINGTLREDEYCPICGEKGHRQFECPHRAKAFKSAGVKCSICGDLSHPTRDCPMKLDAPSSEAVLDTEYDSFLSELNEGGGGSCSSNKIGAATAVVDASSTNRMPVKSGSGPIVVAPIVDMFANKKPQQTQTVIHVTSVMTGSTPPQFLSTTFAEPLVTGTNCVFAPPTSAPYTGGAGVYSNFYTPTAWPTYPTMPLPPPNPPMAPPLPPTSIAPPPPSKYF